MARMSADERQALTAAGLISDFDVEASITGKNAASNSNHGPRMIRRTVSASWSGRSGQPATSSKSFQSLRRFTMLVKSAASGTTSMTGAGEWSWAITTDTPDCSDTWISSGINLIFNGYREVRATSEWCTLLTNPALQRKRIVRGSLSTIE